METTIRINKNVKKQLDSFKVHSRESYNDVILKMIQNSENLDIDKESLIETLEVLSDPEAMRNIAEALEEIEKGNYGVSWEEVKKELELDV